MRGGTSKGIFLRDNDLPEDSALRAQVETADRYSLTLGPVAPESVANLAGLHFFPPVKGIVSGKFDPRSKHFGTDIVTNQNRLLMPLSTVR